MAYVTPQEVRDYTGVAPAWLEKPDQTALDSLLEGWITEAEEMVNDFINTSYPESDVPAGVKNGTKRIVANMIHQARLSRRNSITITDEFGRTTERPGQAPSGNIFTAAIKEDLSTYQVGEGARGQQLAKGSIPFSGSLIPLDDASLAAPDPRTSQFFGTWDHLAYQHPRIEQDQLP